MNRATPQLWIRLSAASLLVLLLLGATGAPVALAWSQQERCAMHCAESEDGGVCCCIADQRERLAERSHDAAPALTQFNQSCASNCAATPAFSNSFSFAQAPITMCSSLLDDESARITFQAAAVPLSHIHTTSHERAPPASLV